MGTMYAMVGEDPPRTVGKWWVFAALDATLRASTSGFEIVS